MSQCLSQYLEQSRELIHQCAREGGHQGLHADRLPDEMHGDPWQRPRRVMKSNDCQWYDEDALGYVPPGPVSPLPPWLRYQLWAQLQVNDPLNITRVTGA